MKVCKGIFLRTYGISNGRIDRALQSQMKESGSPHMDQRGRHEPKNKTPQSAIDEVKAHISSFPKYRSHYSRRDNPNKQYLSPDLSISKMYSLYKEKVSNPVSKWIYHKVFNESFKLSFGRYVTCLLSVSNKAHHYARYSQTLYFSSKGSGYARL